ncbi:MAG: hypothetical protein ACI4XW_00705 [Candidatus Spyradocola sp.]
MKNNNPFAGDRDPEARYRDARNNLLLVVVFTAVNLLMPLLGVDRQFLFSASFPTTLYWWGDYAATDLGMPALRIGAMMIALGCVGLYLLCWLMAKKRRGFMTAALVLFGVDCLSLAGEFVIFELNSSMVFNVLFHLWVLWGLIQGVRAASALKKLEQEQMVFVTEEQNPPA